MINLPTGLDNSLSNGTANIHYLILLYGNMGFKHYTTYSEPITINNEIEYEPYELISLEDIAYLANNTITSVQLEIMYQDGSDVKDEIIYGKWDNADVYVRMIDTNQLDDDNNINEYYCAFRGNITDVKSIKDQSTKVEISSIIKKFDIEKSSKYNPDNCRATFGDSVCKYNINNNTIFGNLTSGNYSQSTITDTQFGNYRNKYFVSGYIKFLSGKNSQINGLINNHFEDTITLSTGFPYDLQDGDEFKVIPFCTKTFSDCDKFDNKNNFYGDRNIIDRNWSFS